MIADQGRITYTSCTSLLGKKDATDEDITRFIDILNNIGSIEFAKNKALDLIEDAKKSISSFEDNEGTQGLSLIADYIGKRLY